MRSQRGSESTGEAMPPIELEYLAIGGGIAIVLLATFMIWRRRVQASLSRRLGQASIDALSNILIPNGEGGEIHIEHALLTGRGVIVIDIKDIEGNVFGSDSMQDWTVISDKRRFTFSNPQPALYDRLAAVARLIPEVPVTGYVAFTSHAEFSKGCPTNVILLDELLHDLRAEKRGAGDPAVDAFYPHWDRLRDEAVATQFGHLLKD